MIKLTPENTQKAIERCKQLKPKVRFIKDRLYVVYSARNENVYHVKFDVQNGERLGQCECLASKRRIICYHMVGAATVNIFRKKLQVGR